MLKNILLVAAGGAVGSVARYLLSKAVQSTVLTSFPFGTLAVNLLGCFALGLLCGIPALQTDRMRGVNLLLCTGFCGGFTTFSTYMNESASLLRDGHALEFALYAGGSVALGLLAVYAGWRTAGGMGGVGI